MKENFIGFFIVALVSIICLIIYKVKWPEKFGPYMVYVIALNIISALVFKPWEFLGY